MTRKKKSKPELRVVFDTSVLFTQVASDLIRGEVKEIIEQNKDHHDLKISWYLPTIVIDERRYQMEQKAFELLPAINKLERLLGHNLNITEDILRIRVNEIVERQMIDLGVSSLKLDSSSVEWDSIIHRAAFRHPPFDPGDKEKGFRDSLIAQSFIQLLSNSPSTPSVCRLAIVANDDLLSQYVQESTKENKNVRILKSISELESLINTLVSEVTEEFINEIKENAKNFFFSKGDESSLYYKEKIGDKIRELYGQELNTVPTSWVFRENGTWWIEEPVFIKKDRQRTFWLTNINIDAKLYKYEITRQQPAGVLGRLTAETLGVEQKSSPSLGLGGLLDNSLEKVEMGSGTTKIEVAWNVNITQTRKLTSPSIDNIKFVSTDWGEKS